MDRSTRAYGLPRQSPSTNRPVGGRATRKRQSSPLARRSPRLRKVQSSDTTVYSSSSDEEPPMKTRCRRSGSSSSGEEPPMKTRCRRSGRGSSSLWQLARYIQEGKKVVFITGAGLSVASGVPVFRTTNNSSRLYSNDLSWKSNPDSTNGSGNNGSPGGSSSSPNKKSPDNKKHGLVEEQPLGIWNSVLWSTATRKAYRKEPLKWYNDFWLRYFPVDDYQDKYKPNEGHFTLATLQQKFPESVEVITQNVDGLQHSAIDHEESDDETAFKLKENVIEAHGRLGLYKCLPTEDSETDSSSDEDDDRLVHLGHRRKYRAWKRKHQEEIMMAIKAIKSQRRRPTPEAPVGTVSTDVSSGSSTNSTAPTCQYQKLHSLKANELLPLGVRGVLKPSKRSRRHARKGSSERDAEDESTREPRLLTKAPRCPSCGNHVLPQSLLFDEGYHSHDHYNFMKIEDWLEQAEVLVFVGTSFAVTLPLVALDHAREVGLPVFNFNVSDMLESNARLNAENITGPSQETLPKLWEAIQQVEEGGTPWEY